MVKTITVLILILFFLPSSTYAAGYCGAWGSTEGGTTPWTVSSDAGGTASIAYGDVDACLDVISEGETLNLPAATATYTSSLIITKAITIIGSGAATTVITGQFDHTYRGVLSYEHGSSTDTDFRLTGVTVDNTGYTAPALSFSVSYSGTTSAYVVENVRIDNNILTGSPAIRMYGITYGVADNNTINGSVSNENGGQETTWNLLSGTVSFGSANNFYYEDNIFNISASSGTISSGHGSLWAARYNTIVNTKTTSATYGFDMHGNMNTIWTNLIAEVYGNNLTMSNETCSLSYMRGGKNLMFFNKSNQDNMANQVWEEWDDGLHSYNTISASSGSSSFTYGRTLPTDANNTAKVYVTYGTGEGETYTITGGQGTTTGSIAPETWVANVSGTAMVYYFTGSKSKDNRVQRVNNTYIWNNRNDSNDLISTSISMDYFYTCDPPCADIENSPAAIAENVAWWQDAASFDGTTGIGCGTLAERDAIDQPGDGICTAGVGYWVTSQDNCASLSGWVGDSTQRTSGVNTYLQGTLYKCNAEGTGWDKYYEPYDYPHPLRGTDTTPPGNPTYAINTAGSSFTVTFDERVTHGLGGTTGWVLTSDGGAVTATYSSGEGSTSLVYQLSRTVYSTETVTGTYTQPTAGITDIAGNEFASVTDVAITNNSTATSGAPTYPKMTLSTGSNVTLSPSGTGSITLAP